MSSSRNKRKRAEADATTMVAPVPSRRGRRSDAEAMAGTKNEGEGSNDIHKPVTDANRNSSSNNMGESGITSGSSENSSTAQQNAATRPSNAAVAQSLVSRTGETSEELTEDEEKNDTDFIISVADANIREGNTGDAVSTATAQQAQPIAQRASSAKNGSSSSGYRNSNNSLPLQTGVSDREQKLRSAVSHRKLLLERVRSGRSAAQSRMQDLARSEARAKATKAAGLGEFSKGGGVAPASAENALDEAEVVAFKKLTRSALQAAKKQRAESIEGGQDKRPSASLRRGHSVGKKMNVVLSPLPPTTGSGSAFIPVDAPAATRPLHMATSTTVSGVADTATSGPAVHATSTVVPLRPNTGHTASKQLRQPTGAALPAKKLKSSNHLSQPAAQPKLNAPLVDSTIPIKSPRIGSQKNPKASLQTTTMARAIPSQPSATLPLHTGLTAPGLPTNRLASQQQLQSPATICPEAVAMREQRKEIRSKLVAHLEERKKRVKHLEKHESDPFYSSLGISPTNAATAATGAAEETKCSSLSIASLVKGPGSALYLPRRRKTHWDNLLTEMKWMATDFMEERKWKGSAARTIASAILASGARNLKGKVEETLTQNADGEVALSDTSAPDTAVKKEFISTTEPEANDGVKSKPYTGWYSKPTIHDKTTSRKVAKIISSMAQELGNATLQAGALSQSDQVHTMALERHHMARKVIEENKADSDGDAESTVVVSGDNASARGPDSKDKPESNAFIKSQADDNSTFEAGSFSLISKAVEALIDSSGKSLRKSSKRKAGSGGKVENEDFALTTWQLDAVEFIEKIWSKNIAAGAVLSGPRAGGKTIAVCSLLWRQRSSGPQLVVCSPYRVVCSIWLPCFR